MKEPYGKAVAPQTGPAPWRCVRKDVLQALAGVRVGWVLSREIIFIRGVEAIPRGRRLHLRVTKARRVRTPRGRRPHACT